MKKLKDHRGFSLIELMVVVSVLGIVAAIAVPNYLRYQSKSRQAEAKTNLGQMFVAEVAYYADNSFFGNFTQIGFVMQSSLSNRYGYRSGAAGPAGGTSTGTVTVDVINPCCGRALEPEQIGMQATNSSPGPSQGFTLTATANLDQDGTVDQWYVNDVKSGLQRANPDDITS